MVDWELILIMVGFMAAMCLTYFISIYLVRRGEQKVK